SGQEMAAKFAEWGLPEESLKATGEIAARCNVNLKKEQFGKVYLPAYAPPAGSPSDFFCKLVEEGLAKRYGTPLPAHVKARYDEELGVIEKMGFISYLLIVWDFIKWAKDSGIPVGPGRGSAAG